MFAFLTGLGLAFPAGLNAYIPLLIVALADRYTGLIHLTDPYDVLSSPASILILCVLLTVELLADKIPLVDHGNDLIQTAVRPAAGAILLMSSTAAVPSFNPVVAMLLGLSVAGIVHVAKSSFRPLVTATTGGVGNPVVSAAEDGTAIVMSVIALIAPILIALFIIALIIAIGIVLRRRRRRVAA